MTGARHQITERLGIGAGSPGGELLTCACGARGAAMEISEHVRRYETLSVPSAIKVGRIRNGLLTRDRERSTFGLEDLGERVFVLVALPGGTRIDDALATARDVLGSILTPSQLREDGSI